MELQKLKVQNFKSIQSVELDLASLNILIGANGSGKSSVIQAVHLACCLIRQTSSIEATKTSTVGIDELDYLPTENYKKLGHRNHWGNKDNTSCSGIDFTFSNESTEYTASCTLRSARNAGISIKGTVDSKLASLLRKKNSFFSAYIPGISGIPNKEEKKGVKSVLKTCSYGDSNIILRNILLLLKEREPSNITLIETWVAEVTDRITLSVSYEDNKDLYIECTANINNEEIPIELLGTGYLQLIQIFSYVLLFNPKILLMDEPDIHLHPTAQRNLVRLLERISGERGFKTIITTHSPFIIRSCSPSVKTYWLKDGGIQSENRAQAELILGWGAFGKRVIICSEDQNTDLLKKIVSQWPELEKFVAFLPGEGYRNLLKPNQARDLKNTLGNNYEIIVHRDRDALTDCEVQRITETYLQESIHVWFPNESDIESYFCSSDFLQNFLGLSQADADSKITEILTQQSANTKQSFESHRKEHNNELYREGGSPPNDQVWQEFQSRALKGAKGKTIFKQLKTRIQHGSFSEQKIISHNFGIEVAPTLKNLLSRLLSS